MSGELFDIPPGDPPRLLLTRKRAINAQNAYDDAKRIMERTGLKIPTYITDELGEANAALGLLEYEAIHGT